MDVPDVNGLVVDSNVLLRGAPVGKVSGMRTSLQASTIDFYVDGQYRIPDDTEVRLENLSALGESYIEFVPRSDAGQTFQDGQRISTKSVTQQPSVSELTTSVVRVLNQLDPDAVKRIIGEADAALPDPNAVLPADTTLVNGAATVNVTFRTVGTQTVTASRSSFRRSAPAV